MEIRLTDNLTVNTARFNDKEIEYFKQCAARYAKRSEKERTVKEETTLKIIVEHNITISFK